MVRADVVELAEALRAVVGSLVRSVRTGDTLPISEAVALGALDRNGPQTTAQLAQSRGVRHQSMAKAVERLAADGLVAKTPHEHDGRKVLLELTPLGREVLSTERARRADRLAEIITAKLSAEEQAVLAEAVDLLGRIADAQ
jgi:DNA-binding MarR family transcriptional regulator